MYAQTSPRARGIRLNAPVAVAREVRARRGPRLKAARRRPARSRRPGARCRPVTSIINGRKFTQWFSTTAPKLVKTFGPFGEVKIEQVSQTELCTLPGRPRRGGQANACFTGWPGGLLYFPPGDPLPANWVRTGFKDGFATNPRCYPARGGQLLDIANDGSFRGARRTAALAREDPDVVARNVGQLLHAAETGKIGHDVAGRLVAGLLSPPLAAAQADERVRTLTREELEQRRLAKLAAVLPEGALSVAQVRNQCDPHQGPWACFSRWPGGWLLYSHKDALAHPDVWIGPTEYGVFLPECFGYVPSPFRWLGHYVIDSVRGALSGAAAREIARRRRRLTIGSTPGAPPGAGAITSATQPAAGARVICDHPAGAWGNPGHYEGGYVAGMEIYWSARGGSCRRV